MAELTYTWWVSHKAKTLRCNKLNQILKRIEPNIQNYNKTHGTRADYMIPLQAEVRSLIATIAATRKSCNSIIHKTTIGYLTEMEKMAKQLKQNISNKIRYFDHTLEGIKHNRIAILKKISAAMKGDKLDIDKDKINEILEMLYAVGQQANKSSVKHKDFGLLTSIIGGRSAGGGLCGRFQKMYKDLDENGLTTPKRKAEVRLELKRFLSWAIH